MNKTKHFKRTALPLSAKSMVSLMLLLIAMLMPQGAWAGACAYTPGCASLEDMQVHLNGTNGNYNGSANNEVVASLKFNYWLDIFNYDGDNGYWDRDLTMKIDDQALTFYSDYACTTKVSTDYSTVLQGVWGVFGDSNEDHTIGKNKSGSGNKAYFKTSGGLTGYINIYNYYAASNKWTTMKVEVFIYDLYGHKVSVCGTYKRSGKSDIAYDYVFYLGGCPRPTNVGITRDTSKKQVNFFWDKQTYSIPSSDLTGETRVKAWDVIDNGRWGVYRDNYSTLIKEITLTMFTSATDAGATCSDSPYTYYVCYEPEATYANNGTRLKGSETSQRGLVGSSSITLNHVWGNSGSEKDPATCTTAAVHYQTCIYCSRTSDANHTYTSGSALGHGTTGFTESYSWTGNAYNNPSQDTKACTFTLTCKKCSTKVVNGASLTCTMTSHVNATCTATGSTTYRATGSYTAANSDYNYSSTNTNVYTVAALGHGSTGYTDSYSWTGNAYNDASQDTKACTFTLTCKKCSTKVVNGASLTCTKMAHVDASCTETGSTTYQATGSYTAANSAYNYSATKTNVYTVAALGHGSTGYTPTYTWGGTYDAATCTFTLHCGSCGVEVFNDNITTTKVDANHVDATCGKDGKERWTATGSYSKAGDATYNGEAQVKDYVIPATGLHAFDDETDPHHTLCTVCKHSFFRYTATEKVEPSSGTLLNGSNRNIYNINKHTFDGENGVIEFDEPLVVIGARAFYQCSAFTGDLIIPKSVKEIGWLAFSECSFTRNLVIGNDVTTIGELAFETANFKGTLTIGNSVRTIEKKAFKGCGFKGDLIIPNSVTNIGQSAFYDCSGFGSLTIGNSVEIIGSSAFSNCTGVKGNLTLGKSVKKIDDGAFRNLRNLSSIQLQSIPQTYEYTFLYTDCTKTVVLSDDSYVYTGSNPNFPGVQSASYTRTGIKNQWGTIVVPFEVNGSGDDYDLYTLSSVSDFELTLTKVNGTLAAGTPVLIRLHDDLDGDYSLTLTASNTTVSGQLNDGSEANGLQLVGTYETIELSADDYFISNNKFWSVGDMVYHGAIGVKTAPFRAYLKSTWAGVKARRNAPASPTELKRLDADGNGVIETADIDLMVASMLNGENDYSIGDVVRAIDNAGTSVATFGATEMLEKGVKGDPDEPELDEYRWITIE